MSSASITELLNGRVKKISNSFLIVLYLRFGINKDWLINGIGEKIVTVPKTKTGFEVEIITAYRKLSPDSKRSLNIVCEAILIKQNM